MRRGTAEPPVIKGFTFVKVLGSGGFSDVFLYEQELPRRKVAVKVLLADDLSPSTRSAFVAEANLMAQLSAHPYIVSIFHADVSDDGRPYFIMEYCSGPSMAERYKSAPFSVVDALRTGVRLSSAVATAHSAGILHRDIKPANVLTNDYGWPALTDFGISSAVEEELPSHTTTRRTLEGTGATSGTQSVGMSIPWSPPEMFDDDPQPDVRSDVFSLAATVYTLLAGRSPFEVVGKSNQSLDLMSRIERGVITPMERTDVPTSLLAVLRKGMATDRDQRFASAVDFARALQRVEMELSYAPTTIDVPNMQVAAPEPRTADPGEDATRARPVTAISAQAPRIHVPGAPDRGTTAVPPQPRIESPSAPEATVVRRAAPVVEEHTVRRPAQQATAPTTEQEGPPKGKRRGVMMGTIAAIAVAAIATVVVVGVVTGGGGAGIDTDVPNNDVSLDDPLDGVAGSAPVPSPAAGPISISDDGSTVTFVWSNPDPVDGDAYTYVRTDGSEARSQVPVPDPVAVFTDIAPGTDICIDVWIRREGVLSADALRMCVP